MRKVALLTLLALVLSVLVLPAAAQDEMVPYPSTHTECAVDMTGSTITIYHIGDLSGAYSFITQPLVAAITDALAYINANGGICGAELAQQYEDTQGNLDNTQTFYDAFKRDYSDMKMLLLYASADSELLRDQLAEDEIVALISAGSVDGLYGENADEPGWIFATNPLYVDQLGSFCNYIGAHADMYPDPTVGYLSWAGAFGQAAFQPETLAYCAEQGVTILETPEIFLPTDTDITTQVLNLVDAGANILYTNSLASGPVLIAETVRALGLEDQLQLAGVNWVMDTSVGLLSSGRAPADGLPAVNGMLGSMPFAWWTETSNPGIAFIRQEAAANERGLSTQNIAYILGWSSVDAIAEIYIQTVNRVGSLDAVTGAELKATTEALDYSPMQLLQMSYEGGQLRAVNGNRIAQMAFLNATGTGPATSRDDVMVVPNPNGGELMIPIVIPLEDFSPAPDLRPGGANVPGM